jgi:predicted dehydrogenase
LLVTLQASIINPGSKQLRYQIKGNKGLYTKYGLDVQEATLRKVDWKTGSPVDVTPVGKDGWGVEADGAEGELELVKEDGSWETVKWVQRVSKTTHSLATRLAYPTLFALRRHASPAGEYQTLYKSLHDAIRSDKGREALLVKPEEAAMVIKIIELGMRASKEGKVLAFEE